MVSTSWCDKSIAINTLRAFRHVVDLAPEVDIVYLVSGFCLPVQRPGYLYQKRIRLPPLHVNGGVTWRPRSNSITVVSTKDGILAGTQWIALERDTIRRLEPDETMFHGQGGCPDEYYIQTLVRRQGIPYQDVPYMDTCKSSPRSRSPIEWKGLDEKRRIVWDTDSSRVDMTGRQFLRFAHDAGYVFVRKFHPLNDIKTYAQLEASMSDEFLDEI